MVQADIQTDVFGAIADPTRRRIIELLAERERTAGELTDPFRMSQPAVSQHLRVLRQAGLVDRERIGRHQQYRLNPVRLQEVYDWVAHYKRFWVAKLRALGDYLDRPQTGRKTRSKRR